MHKLSDLRHLALIFPNFFSKLSPQTSNLILVTDQGASFATDFIEVIHKSSIFISQESVFILESLKFVLEVVVFFDFNGSSHWAALAFIHAMLKSVDSLIFFIN